VWSISGVYRDFLICEHETWRHQSKGITCCWQHNELSPTLKIFRKCRDYWHVWIPWHTSHHKIHPIVLNTRQKSSPEPLLWSTVSCRYSILVSGSSGNILGSTDGLLENWELWIRSLFRGLLDGPGSGEAGLLTSILGLTSGLSCRARWRSMFSLLLKYWPQTGQVIV